MTTQEQRLEPLRIKEKVHQDNIHGINKEIHRLTLQKEEQEKLLQQVHKEIESRKSMN